MKTVITLIGSLFICAIVSASIVKSNIAGRQSNIACAKDEGLSAKSYVQDGLAHQWDGIENVGYGIHDGSASTWIDLVSGVPMKNVKFGDDHAIPTGNTMTDSRVGYYPFYITGDFTMHGYLVNPPRVWVHWTEIGIGKGAGCENGICLSARDGAVNYSVCYRSAYSGTIYAIVHTGTTAGDMYSIDVLFQYSTKTYWVYVDGVLKGSAIIQEENWNLDGQALSVGFGLFQRLDMMGDFKVFDFMFYNRMLSEEEIIYNYELDQRRF